MLCSLDSDSVAIERVREYGELPQVRRGKHQPNIELNSYSRKPPGSVTLMFVHHLGLQGKGLAVPTLSRGEVVLEEVAGRHKASLPPALQGVSLTLAPGEKVGWQGRG